MTSSWVSTLIIQSIISKYLYLKATKTKDSFGGDCINEWCDRRNALVLDLLHNNRDFFYIEFCLIKIIMYLMDYYYIVDVVLHFYQCIIRFLKRKRKGVLALCKKYNLSMNYRMTFLSRFKQANWIDQQLTTNWQTPR